jgi:hypothetical protein
MRTESSLRNVVDDVENCGSCTSLIFGAFVMLLPLPKIFALL